MVRFFKLFSFVGLLCLLSGWGFFAHRKINRLAVFTLPVTMLPFYKHHISYLEEAAVNPDRRRYADPEEGPRHYIDLDAYGDSARTLPLMWSAAVAKVGEDSLVARGTLPWHMQSVYFQLRDAFMLQDPERVLRLSAELGHYVADAHVPLHTTSNYDGQKTGQIGIHGLWESRLPELFFADYEFLVGRATYLDNVPKAVWQMVLHSNQLVDSVLREEQKLAAKYGGQKFSFETKGKQTVKVFSAAYSRDYHRALQGMVEAQMRASVKALGDLWYTAWVDAGQPDLAGWQTYRPTEQELLKRKEELAQWRKAQTKGRPHETEPD